MSKLAKKIAPKGLPVERPAGRPGPRNRCFPLYGAGDYEDWQAVESLRDTLDWRGVQAHIDELLGIEQRLDLERFRFHWRRRCACWPEDLRL